MTLDEFISRLQNPRRAGNGYSCRCPSHDDKKNSLSVSRVDEKILLKCHAGCAIDTILDSLGLKKSDLFADNANGNGRGHAAAHDPIVDHYVYTDEDGRPLYRVCRTASKDFKAQHYDEGGGYVWDMNGVRRVLYNLPAVVKSTVIFFVEGEKDANRLNSIGLVGTTAPFGAASKWSDEYTPSLKGKRVAIFADNDEPGRRHAWKVAKAILSVAEVVKVIELPGLPPQGDVSDFLDGHSKDEFIAIVKAAKAITADDITEHEAQAKGDSAVINSHDSLCSQPARPQPVIDPAAFHGLAGEIVDAIAPYSESDPIAILLNTLTAFGNIINGGPHFLVEKSKHHLNLFVVEVGRSAKGRKGTAWSTPRFMFETVDDAWMLRVGSGLSSGEGLAYAVRDARYEKKPIRKDSRVIDYESVLVDDGETDKRLLCVEEEFSQCLKVMSREGNILSPTLRDAWDGKRLAPITKSSRVIATDAHISIIAHITKDELLRYFTSTEQTNGFGNRFIWVYVKRSKEIATPTGCPDEILNPLIVQLKDAVAFARKVSVIHRDDEAEGVWRGIYHELSAERDGLVGALLARSEPQVMRMACIYALMDCSPMVQTPHLFAALAVWGYATQSVEFTFGKLRGDPAVDQAFEALKQAGNLTTTAIHSLFGRHADKNEIDRVIRELLKIEGVKSEETKGTGGRPSLTLAWVAN